MYYSKILYLSIFFYIFDEWDYFLRKWDGDSNIKLLELVLYINKLYERILKNTSDLNFYWKSLTELTNLLEKIDYFNLIFDNNLSENIMIKLKGFVDSL